ncbi:MAG: HAD family hydrolase [Candidatus Eremiobacteraeota bacterium]|nr:HAD family hydrolase [Candidatus Eremiobacteraeota bacterium]
MITIEIPGRGLLVIETLLLDLNGTLTVDGIVSPEVSERIVLLRQKVKIVIATVDTRNNASAVAANLGIELRRIAHSGEREGKAAVLRDYGAGRTAAMGNGFNDSFMLKEAALGICVLGPEGASPASMAASHIVVPSAQDGLDLLLKPERLIAGLRG